MSNSVSVVIMAAGEGTRMKSKIPKVLHKVCGSSIINYVVDAALQLSDSKPIVVVGHGSESLENHLGEQVYYAWQHERLGTGHAVMMAVPHLTDMVSDYIVVLAGDTPLVTANTLKRMVSYAQQHNYEAVALSAVLDDATGYGRIVRGKDGYFKAIVEHKDASPDELVINEINASMYCFKSESLISALRRLENNNAQGEYYLTDVLSIIKREGNAVGVYIMEDSREMLGVNTRIQLAEAEGIMRERINTRLMLSGVTIMDPANTYIGPKVTIGADTLIYPGNVLEGKTIIGEECVLYPNNRLVDSNVGRGASLQSSVIMESSVGDNTTVGPYAYIRPGSSIGSNVRIGDFVEVKNAVIGDNTKVSHLTYIGDANLGENINVGCGVVCVNYDGSKKHKTTIGNNSFIGCNVNLVAPVEVENDAYIAAGSTITERVPAKSLAIARAKQVNKEGWVDKRRTKDGGEK